MKKRLLIILLLSTAFTMMAGDVKIVNVPEDVTVETGIFKETLVRNLCEEEEIYFVTSITVFDGFIYLLSDKPKGIYKLDFQGKTIGSAGRDGQGPGEFSLGFNLINSGSLLVFHDIYKKMIFYNRELEFVKEIRHPIFSASFTAYVEGCFILSLRSSSATDNYLGVYSPELKLLRSFGKRKTRYVRGKVKFDYVFNLAYDTEKDGVWAAFGNRYDLSYYEKEKLKVEIHEEKDFFKEYQEKDKTTGRLNTEYTGRPLKLEVVKDKVFYFYKKDDKFYFDIFNKNTYKLLRRVRLERFYRRMAHYKDGIFFGIFYGSKGKEDFQLYRIELK